MNLSTATDLLSKLDDSKRAMANLLARENITVQIVPGAPTASFDVVRRVLTIPNWEGLTIDQFDMLIGHEVGHAMFTNESYIEAVCKNRKNPNTLKSYWNVCEDAYIERKMKNSYPGLQRVFYNAYQSFHQNGPLLKGTRTHLFNPKTGEAVAINKMRLIDRINLFYKLGAFVDVKFTDVEKAFIRKIDRITCTEDAVEIAKSLIAYAKEQDEKSKSQPQQSQPQPQPEQNEEQDEQNDQQEESDESTDSNDQNEQNEESDDQREESDETEESDEDDTTDKRDPKDEGEDESDESESTENADDQNESENDESESANGNDAENDSDDQTDNDSDNEGEGDDESDDESESTESGEESDDESADEGDGAADSDDDSTESESSESSNDGGDGAGSGESLPSDAEDFEDESETDTNSADALKEAAAAAEQGPRHILCAPLDAAVVAKRSVSAQEYAEIIEPFILKDPSAVRELNDTETKWQSDYLSTAKLMAMEFERKKTAKQLLHASNARTGRLNMAKLHQYKYAEDLFLRTVNVPQGQSHGIVMIIDASGSMNEVFKNVLDQTLLFAHFAFMCKIPFEAYMFTDVARSAYHSETFGASTTAPLTLSLSDDGRLVGLINTTQRASFKKQCRTVLALKALHANRYYQTGALAQSIQSAPWAGLGGTPMYTGMMLAEAHVERMKRTLKLDKMIFMVVSDGGDGDGLQFTDQTIDPRTGKVTPKLSTTHYNQQGFVIRDTVTKKNFPLVRVGQDYAGRSVTQQATNAWAKFIFDLVKARHNASTIWMFLNASFGGGRRRRAESNINMGYNALRAVDSYMPAGAQESYDADDQYVLPKGTGCADLCIIVKGDTIELTENEFESLDTTNMSARKITQKFTESMTGRKTNRKFVNAVMPFIA